MDLFLEAIQTLKDKGWYEDLKAELDEAYNKKSLDIEEQLLNILNSDKVTKEDIKELFKSSIVTSLEYKAQLKGLK
jgi:hypothetical protein